MKVLIVGGVAGGASCAKAGTLSGGMLLRYHAHLFDKRNSGNLSEKFMEPGCIYRHGFFMLPRPIKPTPSFGELMRVADVRFKQGVVILGAVITSTLCAFGGLYGIFFIYFYGILHAAWAGQAYPVL